MVQVVYWIQHAAQDVPSADDWLDACEGQTLSRLRIPKRRSDWRLGRWTAKRASAAYLQLCGRRDAFEAFGIRAATDGAPEVVLRDEAAPLSISLSHSAGLALCAVSTPSIALGCDLERIEPRSAAFIAGYFTPEEHDLVDRAPAPDPWKLWTVLWSAKESALKALRLGLRVDTRWVAIRLRAPECPNGSWSPLEARLGDARLLHGWWQCAGDFVRTIVAEPRPGAPIRLGV